MAHKSVWVVDGFGGRHKFVLIAFHPGRDGRTGGRAVHRFVEK